MSKTTGYIIIGIALCGGVVLLIWLWSDKINAAAQKGIAADNGNSQSNQPGALTQEQLAFPLGL